MMQYLKQKVLGIPVWRRLVGLNSHVSLGSAIELHFLDDSIFRLHRINYQSFHPPKMRLLQLDDVGDIGPPKDLIAAVPKYAILSHTWVPADEEVTFKDLVDRTAQSKAGYKKILFCGQQAKRDGLNHFWVDTCCIDKPNNSELQEAVNSMFALYRNATNCYVFSR